MRRLNCVLLLALLSGNAVAGTCVPRVIDGWVRMTPGAMPMLAGYGRIENSCDNSGVIVGVHSVDFGDVTLHRTTVTGGVSRMRQVVQLPIGAGATAVLEPGGLHLMLMRPRTMPRAGSVITVTFRLQDGRSFSGPLVIRAVAP